ncbi:hypothetical protein T06_10919, partial [Trichinella sp. T6]
LWVHSNWQGTQYSTREANTSTSDTSSLQSVIPVIKNERLRYPPAEQMLPNIAVKCSLMFCNTLMVEKISCYGRR